MKITRWPPAAASSTSASGSATGSAGGDLGGAYPSPDVTGLRGTPICTTTPATNDVLKFNGTEWCPASGVSASLEVKETDSSPDVTGVSVVQVPPGGLTNNGSGNVTLEYVPDRNGAIENLSVVAASSTAQTLNWALYNEWDITLTANCTLTFSNVPNVSGKGAAITIVLRQDGTGSRTVTWPGTVSWVTGSAPVLKTAASSVDVITIFTTDGGTSFGGVAAAGSPLTTKGDLYTFSTTNTRLPVGTNGQALLADSTQTTGLRWGTASDTTEWQHAHVNNVVFSGDGSTTVFVLPAGAVDDMGVSVFVGGSRSQDWALSGGILDTLTFGSAPASGTNNIVVDIVAVLA